MMIAGILSTTKTHENASNTKKTMQKEQVPQITRAWKSDKVGNLETNSAVIPICNESEAELASDTITIMTKTCQTVPIFKRMEKKYISPGYFKLETIPATANAIVNGILNPHAYKHAFRKVASSAAAYTFSTNNQIVPPPFAFTYPLPESRKKETR